MGGANGGRNERKSAVGAGRKYLKKIKKVVSNKRR